MAGGYSVDMVKSAVYGIKDLASSEKSVGKTVQIKAGTRRGKDIQSHAKILVGSSSIQKADLVGLTRSRDMRKRFFRLDF